MIVTFVCPSAPHPIGGVVALYEFGNGLARRGHQVHLVHAPFFRNRIGSLDELAWFAFEPSVEHHLIEPGGGGFPSADICFGNTGDPAHGLPVILIQGSEMLHLGIERDAFRTPGLKICIARWLVDVGQRFGVPPDQFEVVHMGIDQDRYRLTRPIEDRPLAVGILHSDHQAKGWDVGVAALEIAHEQFGDLQVLAFGTSEPRLLLPPWISFTINPDQDTLVQKIYNRSRVFVQASWYEGYGFTAVEAMACGAALVTTDNGGSSDYADPGVTALVSPPGDVAGLATHVVSLLGDDALTHRLAAAGRELAASLSWDQAAADLETCLERYLADPAPYLVPAGPEPPRDTTDPIDWFALR